MPLPLDYTRPPQRERYIPGRRALLIALAGLLVVLAFLPLHSTQSAMDPVTGTVVRQTHWFNGLTTTTRTDTSPLETRLRTSGISWTACLRSFSDTSQNLFGMVTARGCGTMPPIGRLRSGLQNFCDASTNDELREFVRIMQNGTDDEQKAAVDAAWEKVLAPASRLTASPPAAPH